MALTRTKTRAVAGNLADIPGTLPIASTTGDLPAARLGGRWLRRTATSADAHLFAIPAEITAFRQEFEVTEPGVLFLTASLDLVHRGLNVGGGYGSDYPVGFAVRIHHRFAASQAGLAAASQNAIRYAYAAGNIAGIDDHYGQAIFSRVPFAVIPGWYRLALVATSHSTAAPSTDGLIKLNSGSNSDYNYLLSEFEPGLSIE